MALMELSLKSTSQLAAVITENTEIINAYLKSAGFSPETFTGAGINALPPIPDSQTEVVAAKEQIILATEQLNRIITGPAHTLSMGFISSLSDLLEIQFIQRFGIVHLVPAEGISYGDLATKIQLDHDDVERILKRAVLNGSFCEKNNLIKHTATSKLLADNSGIASLVDLFAEEGWPSFSKVVEAIDCSKVVAHTGELTGFSVANNTSDSMYDHLAKDPARMARFAKAMDAFAAGEDFTLVVAAIDWLKVKTVIDVGGAYGPCSIELARTYPHLQCVVQDFEDVVKKGAARLLPDLRNQISFEAHDMFQPQSRVAADVYLFCSIFHNWSDAKCINILKTHIPAFKKGSQIVILDWGLAKADTDSPVVEKSRRTMDLTMLAFFRGKERTSRDWRALIELVDARLEIVFIGLQSPIILITWQG